MSQIKTATMHGCSNLSAAPAGAAGVGAAALPVSFCCFAVTPCFLPVSSLFRRRWISEVNWFAFTVVPALQLRERNLLSSPSCLLLLRPLTVLPPLLLLCFPALPPRRHGCCHARRLLTTSQRA